MDGAITDGAYGRELLQLVLRLPSGIDAVFDRYRIAAMLDHGDWDGLRSNLGALSIEPLEARGIREIVTAPNDRMSVPAATELHQKALFEIYEYESQRAMGAVRRYAQRISGIYPEALWSREDVAIGRHLRYRRLYDTITLAIAEAHAGRLDVALALASEARRLGDEGEPMRVVAQDLSKLVPLGMGEFNTFELATPTLLCQRTGPSPLGTWEIVMYVLPFLALRTDESMSWAAELASRIAARLAFPRGELQAESWRVASDLRSGSPASKTALAGLVALARRASPGLKGLPLFLVGFAERRYDAFKEAETLARRSGNVWLQVSALTWMTALDPGAAVARRLRRLLDVTGWRRPILVPSEIAADAALGITALGERSTSVIELAIVAGRPTVTTEVITRYIDDPVLPASLRTSALNSLVKLGTVHAREILSRLARRSDDVGRTAARLAAGRGGGIGLSEREIEVLSLAADGLTNKQIAEKLFLSPHTIARHVANARAKLGAANRAEAAVRLHRPAD